MHIGVVVSIGVCSLAAGMLIGHRLGQWGILSLLEENCTPEELEFIGRRICRRVSRK